MQRPLTQGPLSLILTVVEAPFRGLVTLTLVPKGRVLWAAVRAKGFMRSPEAVRLPAKPSP